MKWFYFFCCLIKSCFNKTKAKKRKHSEEEDDDDSDEWVDVSSEEETKNDDENVESQVPKLTLAQKEKKASKISSEKIFTQEDFKRIKIEQLKKKVTDKNFTKGKNKNETISIDTDEDEETIKAKRFDLLFLVLIIIKNIFLFELLLFEKNKRDGLVPLSSITHINKKKSHDKESRLETVQV